MFDGHLFFAANDGTHGKELYITDGVSSPSLHNINTDDADGSSPIGFIEGGDYLFFEANDGSTGAELWYYDGSTVLQAADINVGATGGNPFYNRHWGRVLGDFVYYFASTDGDHVQIHRINVETLEEEEIPAPEAGLYSPGGWVCNACRDTMLQAAGNRLFFPYGDDGSVYGQEFGYLEEPTAALPGTTRDGDLTPWAICFAVLAAATGYAGVRLMADSPR